MRPRDGRLRLLSAEILPDGALLWYSLGRLRIERRIRVDTAIADQWSIDNPGPGAVLFEGDVTVDADFRDLFEVRQRKRTTKGRREPVAANGHRLRFEYTAVDGVKQSTDVLAPVDAWQTGDGPARGRVGVQISPGDRRSIEIDIHVRSTLPSPVIADRDWDAWEKTATRFTSDSPDLNAWIERSSLDLFLLSDRTADGYFPAGGIPWFVFLDADGKAIVDSNGPEGNVGFPQAPEELVHFRAMLGKAAVKNGKAEIEALIASLGENPQP